MISKLLGKLKSLLFKTSAPTKPSLVNDKKTTKSSKTTKNKSKKTDSKKIIAKWLLKGARETARDTQEEGKKL